METEGLGVGFFVVVAGVFGLLLGSFLNVCILSWGAEPKESVRRPRSRCPKCGHQIAWYDNIPVLSWLILRARCRHCHQPISPMYPLVELATALIWAGFVWKSGPTIDALRGATFFTLLLGIAITDARAFVIPHEFTLGGTALLVLAQVDMGLAGLLPAVSGALFGAGLLLIVGEIASLALGRDAMGGGDMALMGLIGACLGWQGVLVVVFVGSVVGIILQLLSSWRLEAPPAAEHDDGSTSRWTVIGALSVAGALLVVATAMLARYGLLGDVLIAAGWSVAGAGVAYYVLALPALPRWILETRWARAAGLAVASAAFGLLPRPSALRVAAAVIALLFLGAALSRAKIAEAPPSSETADELQAAGYLPFGVSLAIAAALLALYQGSVSPTEALTTYFSSLGV